jgi:hypothetical protein
MLIQTSSTGALQALAPALIAALGAAVGAYYAAYAGKKGEALATREDFHELIRQVQRTTEATEQVKATIAARSSMGGELRSALHKLTTSMASMIHSMCWVTWAASHPGVLTSEKIDAYDEEVHRLSPEILGHLTSIAAFSYDIYKQIEPLVWEIFRLDASIGSACVEARNGGGSARLLDLQQESVDAMHRLPHAIAGIISQAAAEPPLSGNPAVSG